MTLESPFLAGPWGTQLSDLGRQMTEEEATGRMSDHELSQLVVFLTGWQQAAMKELSRRQQ